MTPLERATLAYVQANENKKAQDELGISQAAQSQTLLQMEVAYEDLEREAQKVRYAAESDQILDLWAARNGLHDAAEAAEEDGA